MTNDIAGLIEQHEPSLLRAPSEESVLRGINMDWKQVRAGVVQMMAGLGCDLRDPDFIKTPDRIVGSFQETLVGLNGNLDGQIAELLTSVFPCEHQQMVVANGIEVFLMCPASFFAGPL